MPTLPLRAIARRIGAGWPSVGYHRRRAARPSHGGLPERDRLMQQRSQVATVAIIAAVVIGALAIFAFLNRGPDTGALTGRTWQLAAITGQTPSFQGVFPPEEQTLYTLEFATDGTLAAKADCNAVAGTYELSGNDGMTITLGASTLVACPDGSYGTIFAHELANVTTWVIASAELTLTTADGGSGTFVEGSAHPRRPEPLGVAERQRVAEPDRVAEPVAEPDPTRRRVRRHRRRPARARRLRRRPRLRRPTRRPRRPPRPRPRRPPRRRPRHRRRHRPQHRPRPRHRPRRRPRRRRAAARTWSARTGSSPTSRPATRCTRASSRSRSARSTRSRSRQVAQFSAVADCNTVNGTWTATADGGLTLQIGAVIHRGLRRRLAWRPVHPGAVEYRELRRRDQHPDGHPRRRRHARVRTHP